MSLTQRLFGAGEPDYPDPERINLGIEPHVAIDVLKNERRQRVLIELDRSESGEMGIGELAEIIAAYEHGIPVEGITTKQRKAAYIGLYQHHLPKLDKVGLIDYDEDQGIAEITDDADGVVEFMQVLDVMLEGQ